MASHTCPDCGVAVPAGNIELHRLRCRGTTGYTGRNSTSAREEWSCSQCTLLNSADVSVCAACGQEKRGRVPAQRHRLSNDTNHFNTIGSNPEQERIRSPPRRPTSPGSFRQASFLPFGQFGNETDLFNIIDSNFAQEGTRSPRRRPLPPFARVGGSFGARGTFQPSGSAQQRLSVLHQSLFPGMSPLQLSAALDFDTEDLRRALAASEEEQVQSRPARSQDVQALPTCSLDAPQLAALPEANKACVICMESFCQGDVVRTLPCLHRFHRDCVDQWFKQQGSCPTCKHRLGDDNEIA